MPNAAANARFLPLVDYLADDACEFELLFKVQDAQIFALIDPERDVRFDHDDDRGETDGAIGSAQLETACDAGRELEIRDAEIATLNSKLSEYRNDIETLRQNRDARHAASVAAELSTLSETVDKICNGMQTAITDAICSEMALIVAPFLERSVLELSVAKLEVTMREMLDGSTDEYFLIAGSKETLEKLSPLFEINKFRFKFNFVDSSEVTVEYDNRLLSTRLADWARLLRPEYAG